MIEEWRTVVGFPKYDVSNVGNVRRSDTHKPLRHAHVSKQTGYVQVTLCKGKPVKLYYHNVHRLVAAAFIGEANGRQVNHIDANRANNMISNLEYVTIRQNVHHCMKLGRHARGTRINGCTLDEQKVRTIRARLSQGIPQLHIAMSLGVSKDAVHLVAKGRTWRWLD